LASRGDSKAQQKKGQQKGFLGNVKWSSLTRMVGTLEIVTLELRLVQ
jgi:hypothetical protein